MLLDTSRERNKHLTDTGSAQSLSEDGTRKSKLLPKGKTTDPQDSEKNKQLIDMRLPNSPPKDGTRKSLLFPDGTTLVPRDSVDKTQSTQFEESVTNHNKDKTSSKVEPVSNTHIIASLRDFQELIEDFDEELKDYESLTSSMALRHLDDNVPTTERVLAKNLQWFSKFVYDQIVEDSWEKHEEHVASCADLKAKIKGSLDQVYKERDTTNNSLNNVMKLFENVKKDHAL
ncbi:hypothetical protein Tco_1280256 [Tanacetum coccineum]